MVVMRANTSKSPDCTPVCNAGRKVRYTNTGSDPRRSPGSIVEEEMYFSSSGHNTNPRRLLSSGPMRAHKRRKAYLGRY
jgi:hypothetical protein